MKTDGLRRPIPTSTDTERKPKAILQIYFIYFNPSNAKATFVICFRTKHMDAEILENHLNPIMLVFIRKLLDEYPYASVCSHFSAFWHDFAFAKLATSSIRIKPFREHMALGGEPISIPTDTG